MGWVVALLLAALSAAALLWRTRGPARIGAAATVLAALAGYAWQGSPALPGAPEPRGEIAAMPPTLFSLERARWLGEYGDDNAHLTWAETLQRWGWEDRAIASLQAGLRARPTSAILWMGLANALVVKNEYQVSPAAALAFGRAATFAPASPAPAYFLGLALAQAGRFDEAAATWRGLLATPLLRGDQRDEVSRKIAALEAMTP